MLPALRLAIERKDNAAAQGALDQIAAALAKLESHIKAIQVNLPGAS
jgi:hypothetical protein